jgi:hypothetical protein
MRIVSSQELKIIGLVVAAATVLAILITVVVRLGSGSRKAPVAENPTTTQTQDSIMVSEFLIPEDYSVDSESDWFFSREPLQRWTRDQIERYWIDPRDIGIELLQETNDTLIEQLMEGIP